MKQIYPLDNLKPHDCFFVAGLDVDRIRERGMSAALQYRYKMKATVGIYNGLIGVRFCRLPGGLTRLRTSSVSEYLSDDDASLLE
jgi:hypothetical protein